MDERAPRLVDLPEQQDMPRPIAALDLLYELARRRHARLAALRGEAVLDDNKVS